MSKIHPTNDCQSWRASNEDYGNSRWKGLAYEDGTIMAIAVAHDPDHRADPDVKGHARRLAACWNFCMNMETRHLEDNINLQELIRRYNNLVVAMNDLAEFVEQHVSDSDQPVSLQNARAALESAYGRQP